MNKAFTKDDDDAGFEPPPRSSSLAVPEGPFRLTAAGARRLAEHPDPGVRAAIARAEVLPPTPPRPERAALGVTVTTRDDRGLVRDLLLVSSEEHALTGEGSSVASPLGRALVGARVGDVREVALPRGTEEIEILGLRGG